MKFLLLRDTVLEQDPGHAKGGKKRRKSRGAWRSTEKSGETSRRKEILTPTPESWVERQKGKLFGADVGGARRERKQTGKERN